MINHKPTLSLPQILFCSALILTFSMGIRHGLGLWLQPMALSHQWGRETFAFAIGIQNLSWGFAGIFAGILADRFGAVKVLISGSLLYSLGLFGMTQVSSSTGLAITAGLMLGMAQAGTTYIVLYGIIGRNVAPDKRSTAMGITAAAGSFGQFLMVPTETFLIQRMGWEFALQILAISCLIMIPLAWRLREKTFSSGSAPIREQTISAAFKEAMRYPSFLLLMAGYFVCGFQVVFIGVHMPSYLSDQGLPLHVAGYGLALIGLFNVFGSYAAGLLGEFFAKRKVLAVIYLSRSIVISVFLLAPLTPTTVYIFCGTMGLLWLSTIPPTNAMIAQIFGVHHLSMLLGFVFMSHQVGSFLGVWLGGRLYDYTGSYNVVWYISIALGVMAALVNLPIKEQSINRTLQPATA